MAGFLIGPSGIAPAAPVGGAGPLVFTITDSDGVTGAPAPPLTFTAAAIGTASSDRIVCVAIAVLGSAGTQMDYSSVTIGGVAATQAVYVRNGPRSHGVYYALVTAGTTANIVISGYTNGFVEGVVINVGIMTGSATASVATTTTGPAYPTSGATAVTVPTNGMCVICGYADSNGTPNTSIAYTNATGQFANNGAAFQVTGSIAYRDSSATITQSVTNSGGADGWVSAEFQP